MRAWLPLVLMLLSPTLTSAAVYKWVDPDGTVHFSDTPHEGAQELHVAPPQTYTPGRVPPITPREEAPPAPVEYTRFELVSPTDDATLRDNTGAITLKFALEPALKVARGHKLIVLLDGQAQPAAKSGSITLQNVDRGTHTLQGQVVDSGGKILMSSKSITVHLFRQSILAPNRARPPSP